MNRWLSGRSGGSKKISRCPVQIAPEDGLAVIESLAENNPTSLNGEREPILGKRELLPDLHICGGRCAVVLTLICRETDRKGE